MVSPGCELVLHVTAFPLSYHRVIGSACSIARLGDGGAFTSFTALVTCLVCELPVLWWRLYVQQLCTQLFGSKLLGMESDVNVSQKFQVLGCNFATA